MTLNEIAGAHVRFAKTKHEDLHGAKTARLAKTQPKHRQTKSSNTLRKPLVSKRDVQETSAEHTQVTCSFQNRDISGRSSVRRKREETPLSRQKSNRKRRREEGERERKRGKKTQVSDRRQVHEQARWSRCKRLQ